MNRSRELEIAVVAARAAARVCRAVAAHLVTADALQKKDKSPVTVADFASQAVVCAHLATELPQDGVVGEEGSADLQGAATAALRAQVVARVGDEIGRACPDAEVLEWIDRGGAPATGARYWTLDPIDGTKGFLRGEQYAIALGLIEEGRVVLGVLACPNLPLGSGQGALFGAIRGAGAWVEPLAGGTREAIRAAAPATLAEARFCESVESGHSDQSESAAIAERLGIKLQPYRIDSQCKYGAVARGDASIYLRLPTRADYREKIWDHAAGVCIVEEAGARVSDVDGRALDFGRGATLEANRGVIATAASIHDAVLDAVRTVRGG